MSESRTRSPKLLIGVIVVGFALLSGAVFWKHLSASRAETSDQEIAAFKGRMPPLKWVAASKAQRKAATATIVGQLEAFKHNQWDKAVSFQSSLLQKNFGSTDQFRQIIQGAYPQFAKYHSVAFGRALAAGDVMQVEIKLEGADGVKVQALYFLQKEAGMYHIQGVSGGIAPGQRRPIPMRQDDGALPA